MGSVLTRFDKWKEFLSERVEQAKAAGMSEETIANLAFQIGEFLEEKIDPKNGEELLLQQLWQVGTEDEQKALARMMVKLVERT